MVNELRKIALEIRAEKQKLLERSTRAHRTLSELVLPESPNVDVARAYAEDLAYNGIELEEGAPPPERPYSDYLKGLYDRQSDTEKEKLAETIRGRKETLKSIMTLNVSEEISAEKDVEVRKRILRANSGEKERAGLAFTHLSFLEKLFGLVKE